MDLAQFIQARQDGTLRPRSPSPRTPASSRHLNTADVIEENMQRDGHVTWGFVIYRTTYASDDDWARVRSRLRAAAEECFQFYNGLDVLQLKADTVMDDGSVFNGVDSHFVREHFRQWVADNLSAEQGERHSPKPPLSPRYRFAIQVDAEALASILNEPAGSYVKVPNELKGWVKLIDADWRPGRWSTAEGHEVIEGVAQEDVGWMKQPWEDIDGQLYLSCNDLNFWPSSYTRPPALPYY